MAKHERNRIDKQEEIDEKRSPGRKRNQSPYDQLKAPGEDTVPILETPFKPQIDKHAALLAGARSDVQRANLVLQLQRDYGNTYVQRLLKSRAVQAKLTVNPPDDSYEKEADSVAETVTKNTTSEVQRQEEDELQVKPASEVQRQAEEEEREEEEGPVQAKPASEVQRQEEEEEKEEEEGSVQAKPASEVQRQAEEEEREEEEGSVQAKPASEIQRQEEEEEREEEEEPVQAKPAGSQSAMASEYIETRINTARGGGRPLAESVRDSLEPQFERDFSGVRVHDDDEANKLSHQLGAEAFTTGRDIFFREGTYQPDTDSGKKLVAHELTHVVQQQSAPALQQQTIQRKKSEVVPDLTEETYTAVNANLQTNKAKALKLLLAEIKDSKMPDLANDKCDDNPVRYDASVTGEGVTTYKTWDPVKKEVSGIYMKIGNKAFASVAWLYSTVMHEYVHVQQFITDPLMAIGISEFASYTWEILQAHNTGVIKNKEQMKDLGRRLKSEAWDKMTDDEKKGNQETYDKAIKVVQTAIGEKDWQP